jgi:hypothetical protein
VFNEAEHNVCLQKTDEYRTALDWISERNYWTSQHNYFACAEDGTGQWLLGSPQFKDWVESGIVFCGVVDVELRGTRTDSWQVSRQLASELADELASDIASDVARKLTTGNQLPRFWISYLSSRLILSSIKSFVANSTSYEPGSAPSNVVVS